MQCCVFSLQELDITVRHAPPGIEAPPNQVALQRLTIGLVSAALAPASLAAITSLTSLELAFVWDAFLEHPAATEASTHLRAAAVTGLLRHLAALPLLEQLEWNLRELPIDYSLDSDSDSDSESDPEHSQAEAEIHEAVEALSTGRPSPAVADAPFPRSGVLEVRLRECHDPVLAWRLGLPEWVASMGRLQRLCLQRSEYAKYGAEVIAALSRAARPGAVVSVSN